MGCTVRELLARIDSAELTEWEAYEVVTGPIGDERLDQLFAMLQSTIANVNRSKRQRPYRTDQFVPKWGHAAEVKPQSGSDMLDLVKRLNRKMGGVEGGDSGGSADQDRRGHVERRQGQGERGPAREVVRGRRGESTPGQ